MIRGTRIQVHTKGFSDMVDITGKVRGCVAASGVANGLVNIFVVGSTASVSTVEFEPALVADVKEQLEKLVPSNLPSRHSETWGDDNGFSHIRATIMGPSVTAPIENGHVVLGTWQQIVVVDHDNRARNRELFVQVMGE
jgi:secondary thiamine-phosphate synthase enzyme